MLLDKWNELLREAGLYVTGITPLSGGSTGHIYKLSTHNGPYVAKLADHKFLAAEFDALKSLNEAGISAPQALALVSLSGSESALIMSFIDSGDNYYRNKNWADFLEKLRSLHSIKNDRFGWHTDNYIGVLDQPNTWNESWSSFFLENRLDYQWRQGIVEGSIGKDLESAYKTFREKYSHFLADIEISPSLLHGDLWTGNLLFDTKGRAYFIDPSIYYGHWEVDVAMMQLFGGFSERTILEYLELHQVVNDPNLRIRLKIYQLYYLIIHLRMFGNSYLDPVCRILSM